MIEVIVKDKETGEEVRHLECEGVWMCLFDTEENEGNKRPFSRGCTAGTVRLHNATDIGIQVRDLLYNRNRDPEFANFLFMQGFAGGAAEDERGTDDAASD